MIKTIKNQYGSSRFTGSFIFKVIIVCLLSLVASGVYLVSKKQSVIIIKFDNHACLLEGETFELKWMHSVEKQWWIEAYQRQGDALLLTDTYFETFGAGSPSRSANNLTQKSFDIHTIDNVKDTQTLQKQQFDKYQSRQRYLNQKYRGYVHYQVNQQLPYLNWMISSNIKAVIINHQKTLPVYQWVSDYTTIYIAPEEMSLWAQMLQEPCYDYHQPDTDRISN